MAYNSDATAAILPEIMTERAYQESLVREGKFLWTCAANYKPNHPDNVHTKSEPVTLAEKLSVLGEEFGEVAKEVTEHIIVTDRFLPQSARDAIKLKLRKELIQTAAVAIAWVEALDAERAL